MKHIFKTVGATILCLGILCVTACAQNNVPTPGTGIVEGFENISSTNTVTSGPTNSS